MGLLADQGDVAEPATARGFVEGAVAALGRVDVFVNNAGICPFHAFLDMPAETFERTMRVNMHGAYFMRSEEHTSELPSLMRISYAVFCLKKKNISNQQNNQCKTDT